MKEKKAHLKIKIAHNAVVDTIGIQCMNADKNETTSSMTLYFIHNTSDETSAFDFA